MGTSWKHIIAMGIGVFECIFFTVVHAGWPSMVYLYQRNGLFSEECPVSNQTSSQDTNTTALPEDCGNGGGFYFSVAYGVAVVVQNLTSFPTGIFYDRYGIFKTRLLGTLTVICACACLAFASKELPWLIFLGLPLLVTTGNTIMVTTTHLSQLAEKATSTMATLYTGCMIIATIPFLIIKEVYETFQFDYKYTFFMYLGLWSIVLINAIFFCPRFKANSPPQQSADTKINNCKEIAMLAADEKLFTRVVKAPLFWLLVYWFSTQFLKLVFTVASLNSWFALITSDVEEVSYYTNVYSFTSFGAVIISPLCGFIIDMSKKTSWGGGTDSPVSRSMPTVPALLAATLLSTLHCVSALFTSPAAIYVQLILLFLLQIFLFGTVYAFIGIVFPVPTYGKCVGLCASVTGILSLLQYPILMWPEKIGRYTDPNLMFLALMPTTLALPVYIMVQYHKKSNRAA